MKKGNTLGIILILIGVSWIIFQTGIISVNWYAAIRALWPLFLVAAGAGMLIGHRKKLNTVIWILTFIIFFGFGIYKADEPLNHFEWKGNFGKDSISTGEKEPFMDEIQLPDGTKEGRLILELGGIKLNLGKGSNNLLAKTESNISDLEQRFEEGEQAVLEYRHGKYQSGNTIRSFDLEVNPTLLWEVDTNLGVIDGEMDFSEIPLKSMDLQLGAGKMVLIIGDRQGNAHIDLRAGASDIDIHVPEGVGLKVETGNFLTDLSFNNVSMIADNGVYVTENYENASHKIDINIITALSAIEIFVR